MHLAQFIEGGRDELLPAKPRVDAHQQHDIHLVHDVLEAVERGCRVEDEARLAPGRAHEAERAVDVIRRLGMERDEGCARIGEPAPRAWAHTRRVGARDLGGMRARCQRNLGAISPLTPR